MVLCSAPSRRYYITRSFVFDGVEKVEAVLSRLRKLREADHEAVDEQKTDGALDDRVSEEGKEPNEKRIRLLDSG